MGEVPTDANVKAEVENILKRRTEVSGRDILQQNVLVVSGDEILTKSTGHPGEVRFGKQALKDAVIDRHRASSVPLTMNYWNPFVTDAAPYYSNQESVAEAKAGIIKAVETSLSPLTVILDGHGNVDVFGLSGHVDSTTGEIVGNAEEAISTSEFADALQIRYQAEQKLGHDGLRISLVSGACFMQNFMRNLAVILRERDVPLPEAMIISSEYGQEGFSDWDNPFGSRFNELIATSPNLGAIMDYKHNVKVSDPSVFVPRKEDPKQLMQISGIVTATFVEVA